MLSNIDVIGRGEQTQGKSVDQSLVLTRSGSKEHTKKQGNGNVNG